MGLIFAGTPEFAATILAALLAQSDPGHEVLAVYTQPDRPAGRGRRTTASPVKALALEHGLPVEQPVGLKSPEARERLAGYGAEAMIVAAYGLLLPPAVLATPPRGCINVHASLLPRWRGAAPIQHAILAGDRETGITIMQMDAGLDTGPALLRAACPIRDDDTSGTLHDRLADLGATTLLDALARLRAGTLEAEPQDDALATHAGRIAKADGLLDWTRPAAELERRIRAYDPWPVAYTHLPDAGGRLRVWSARVAGAADAGAAPGTIVACGADGIRIATGDGDLCIVRLQPEGRRVMASADYLLAHDLQPGMRLGGEDPT